MCMIKSKMNIRACVLLHILQVYLLKLHTHACFNHVLLQTLFGTCS